MVRITNLYRLSISTRACIYSHKYTWGLRAPVVQQCTSLALRKIFRTLLHHRRYTHCNNIDVGGGGGISLTIISEKLSKGKERKVKPAKGDVLMNYS